MRLSIDIQGVPQLKNALALYSKKSMDKARKAVETFVFAVQNDAVKAIRSGAKSGVEYTKGGKTKRRSAPGEAPATDEGELVAGIIPIMNRDGSPGGKVVSRAEYSSELELGTDQMEARPFMFPASEKNKPALIKALKSAFKKG
jgi:HK97 gp10 family phage protein